MLSKRIISEIKSLHQSKFRNQTGTFLAEGEKVVNELLRSGLTIKLIAGLPEYLSTIKPHSNIGEIHEINNDDLSRISLLSSPNMVLAVVETPLPLQIHFDQLTGTILMLDGIRDPGNLGTIIRTADWFGVQAIFCSSDCVDCYNPKVVQSAMGSLFRIPVLYGALENFINESKNKGEYFVVGASLEGASGFPQSAGSKKVLVIGSESHGLSPEVLKTVDYKITIRKAANSSAESLNAAVACGVLLSEMV